MEEEYAFPAYISAEDMDRYRQVAQNASYDTNLDRLVAEDWDRRSAPAPSPDVKPGTQTEDPLAPPKFWTAREVEDSRTTATGAFFREAAESAPSLGTSLIAGGRAAMMAMPYGGLYTAIPAGLAVGAGTALLTRELQEKITDYFGITSAESRERARAEHPYATLAGGVAPSALFLRPAFNAGWIPAERA